MKKMMERFKNERGLTLVELLAVVVILAIIGTIAFVLIGNIIENSRKDAHIANAQQLIHAAKLYEADGGEVDGVTDTTLTEKDFLEPLINPWNTEDAYSGSVTKTEGGEYTVTLTSENEECDLTDINEEDVLTKGRELCENEG